MRVIAGKFRSRPLAAPAGLDTRPTSDRLRETLFNVLTNGAIERIAGKAFLDLYAGSGAVGIEAISRGASQVTFVEQAAPALTMLRKNLDGLGLKPSRALKVDKRSVVKFLKAIQEDNGTQRFDVIFLDPPYESAEEYATTLNLLGAEGSSLLAADGLVIAEHRKQSPTAESYG